MSSATENHGHIVDPGRPITVVRGLEFTTCYCLVQLIRQVPDFGTGRVSLPIPRDWNLAHAEAAEEMQRHFDTAETGAHLGRIADRVQREAFLRDLAALRQFYLDNPDFPVPWAGTINVHADAETLRAIADKYAGGHLYPPVSRNQCDFEVPGASLLSFIVSIDQSSSRGPL